MVIILYIAHKNDNLVQTVKEHCLATAERGEGYSNRQFKKIVYAMGMLHDIGKYQNSFQKKIISDLNSMVEHSTCGAVAAKEKYKDALLLLMQYCIAGHHSGIPNGGYANDTSDMNTLCGRLKREFEDYSVYKKELCLPEINENEFNNFLIDGCSNPKDIIEKFSFVVRYCFSCLTDADSNDTAEFCNGVKNHSLKADFQKCLTKLNNKLSSFVCSTDLQKARSQIQNQVYKKTDLNSEIYLMNMPTGSGKTLCSMKFALERAIKTNKKRIIYIIPYNSIIDQTAELFENLFGNDAEILRHQSSFSYDDTDYTEDYKNVVRLATENWDAQIIITTAVQFFESVYANKRGKLRKMHNMADSILVFDEAHLMPENYLQPCLRVISYITKILGSEAIFLTATMPDFKRLIKEYSLKNSMITDLINDTTLFKKFQKCTYENIGGIDIYNLVARSHSLPSALIVVNKKLVAREIYSLCKGKKYHLSTYMTAYDRKRTIENIKNDLLNLERDYPNYEDVPDERKITVVSTSLIEAGVDLDFYCVFRELSGLDSILQAGGRCNREGKRKNSKVYIFSLNDRKSFLTDNRTNLTEGLLSEYNDISCLESITSYYDRLFFMNRKNIVMNSISEKCSDIRSIPFKTYSEEFEIIGENTISVVVERDNVSKSLIDNIRFAGVANQRDLQKYAFTVYRYEFDELYKQHIVDDFGSGIWCLTNNDYYDENIGVTFEAKDYFIN